MSAAGQDGGLEETLVVLNFVGFDSTELHGCAAIDAVRGEWADRLGAVFLFGDGPNDCNARSLEGQSGRCSSRVSPGGGMVKFSRRTGVAPTS